MHSRLMNRSVYPDGKSSGFFHSVNNRGSFLNLEYPRAQVKAGMPIGDAMQSSESFRPIGTPGKRIIFAGSKKKKKSGGIKRKHLRGLDPEFFKKKILIVRPKYTFKDDKAGNLVTTEIETKTKEAKKTEPKFTPIPRSKSLVVYQPPKAKLKAKFAPSIPNIPKKQAKPPLRALKKKINWADDGSGYDVILQQNRKLNKKFPQWKKRAVKKILAESGIKVNREIKMGGTMLKSLKSLKAPVRISGARKRKFALNGLANADKKLLFAGGIVGAGASFGTKKGLEAVLDKAALPAFLSGNEKEIVALANLLLSLALISGAKTKSIGANRKAADVLTGAGIGLALGTLGQFGWDKFKANDIASYAAVPDSSSSEETALSGILPNRHGRLSGFRNLTIPALGVGALGLNGSARVKSLNGAIRFKGAARVAGAVKPRALNGAATLVTSAQTGLSEAEMGL